MTKVSLLDTNSFRISKLNGLGTSILFVHNVEICSDTVYCGRRCTYPVLLAIYSLSDVSSVNIVLNVIMVL